MTRLIPEDVHVHNWSEKDSTKVAEGLNDLYNKGKGETHIKSVGRAVFLENKDMAQTLHAELSYWLPDEKA